MKREVTKVTKVMGMLLVAALLATGCGNKSTTSAAEPVGTEKESAITEEDLANVIEGIDDKYVLEGSKNVDLAYNVVADEDVVKKVEVDDSKVDMTKPGVYKVVYTVTVDPVALKEANEKAEVQVVEDTTADKDTEDTTKATTTDKAAEDTTKTDATTDKKTEDTTKSDTSTGQKEENITESNTSSDTDKKSADTKTESTDKQNTGNASDTDTAKETDTEKATDQTDTNESNTEKSDDTVRPDSENDVEVEIEKDVEVVDEAKAKELADKGETVWTDDNETVEPEKVVSSNL